MAILILNEYGAAFDPKTPYYTINSSQALGTVPIMLASSIGLSATSMSTGGVLPNGTVITLSYNVGDINYAPHKILVGGMVPNSVLPIRLYAPSYHMNPAREIQFLQQGTKRVTYRDIFSYQARNIGQGAFEVPVTNALANVKKVVVVPIFNQSSNGGISPLLSPFATEGATTSPLVGTLNSFNIRYGGSPFLNMDIRYGYEHFLEHVYGVNSINGGGSVGVNSGLLDFDKWQNNYQYYVINLSRRLKEEDRIPKAVHVVGNNNNLVNIDLYIFLEIEKEIVIDLATGARVA